MKQEAFRATEREGLAWKGLETGGLWLGKSVAEGLLVEDHIGPGPSARHYPAFFEPDTEFQNRELDHLRQVHPERQLIATWHSHPDYLTTPSGHDAESARSILRDWNLARPEIVVGIAVVRDGNFSLRAFHMTTENASFQEIGIEVEAAAEAPRPAVDPSAWLNLPAGREYLAGLVKAAQRHRFDCRAEGTTNGLTLLLARAEPVRTAKLVFPAEFPFGPAWIVFPGHRQRIGPDSVRGARLLERELRRAIGRRTSG
jgi:proteasome lid subunit RPN8/RPN11